MKKNLIYSIGTFLIAGSMLSSCYFGSSESYFGTMAGAEIGGVIGESLGWISTSRHGGPGTAMLGRVLGTVAGGAIGNSIGNRASESRKERRAARRQRQQQTTSYNNDYYSGSNDDYTIGDYQTEGGRSKVYNNTASSLSISNMYFEDEDGDAKLNKNETLNIIYEVTNSSSTPAEVRLITGTAKDSRLEFSPEMTTTIEAGKTIRYKAKVFCKKVPTGTYIDIPVTVISDTHGTVKDSIRVKNGK